MFERSLTVFFSISMRKAQFVCNITPLNKKTAKYVKLKQDRHHLLVSRSRQTIQCTHIRREIYYVYIQDTCGRILRLICMPDPSSFLVLPASVN